MQTPLIAMPSQVIIVRISEQYAIRLNYFVSMIRTAFVARSMTVYIRYDTIRDSCVWSKNNCILQGIA